MLISASDTARLTQNQLTLWLNFIEHQVGFVLPSSQVNWVKGVIERHLQKNQLDSTALLEAVMLDKSLYHALFDDILIPRTQFFRHSPSFALMAQYAKQWQRHPTLDQSAKSSSASSLFTAWSVGCSTGQEAVSMLLTLKDVLPATQTIAIYGSDFHQKSLQQARQGKYTLTELTFIPARFHPMLNIDKDRFSLPALHQKCLHFFSQNLIDFSQPLPVASKSCQLIVCKNVLIYFRQFEQRDIIKQLMTFLADDGILIFGAGELLQLGDLPLCHLPIPTVNAFCKLEASDWVTQLTL